MRLRADPEAARALEKEYKETGFASHPGPFPTDRLEAVFLQKWRRVVGLEEGIQTVDIALLEDPLILLTYSAKGRLESSAAQASGEQGGEDLWRGIDTSADDSFVDLGLLDDMELQNGEDWQAWIESAIHAEHVDILGEDQDL